MPWKDFYNHYLSMPTKIYELPELRLLQDARGQSLLGKALTIPTGIKAPFWVDMPATIFVVDLDPPANLGHPHAIGINQPGYGTHYFIHNMPLHESLEAYLVTPENPPSKDTQLQCDHNALMGLMSHYPDKDTLITLSEEEIRTKYPRIDDVCPACQERVILYSSWVHYLAGDW